MEELRGHHAEVETQNEELRRARVDLELSRDRYYELYDLAPVAHATVDLNGRIVEANLTMAELLGVARARLLGRSIGSFCSNDDAALFHRLLHQVRTRGSKEGCELELLTADRRRTAAHVDVMRVLNPEGQKATFRCVFIDLTALRAAEARLRESEQRLRQIADTIEDAFYVLERDGQLSYVSRASETIMGRDAAELLAEKGAWQALVHPADREQVADARHHILRGDQLDLEYRIRRPDGTLRWVRDRAFSVEDAYGHVLRTVGIVHDVTSERELEEELRQAQKMEAVGALASGIAHDFNNLLHVVRGFATMAADKKTPIDKAREHMRRVASVAQRGSELTKQLMTFARKGAAEPGPIVLDDVVTATAPLLARLLTEKIRLQVEPRAGRCAVIADRVQIEQILMNLASNARDAMPDGGALVVETRALGPRDPLPLTRELRPASRYVQLRVSDTGAGMDEATQRRIFEPFFTTKVTGHGTGLGLATVFTVTRRIGGHVEVASAPGEGATFTITLPSAAVTSAKAGSNDGSAMRFAGSALLVEDDPLVRATVRHDLEALGLRVIEAANVDEGGRRFEAHRPTLALLVTDIAMPGGTGLKLANHVRRSHPSLPTLLISAYPSADLRPDRRGKTKTVVLQKPFGRDELAQALAALLRPVARAADG